MLSKVYRADGSEINPQCRPDPKHRFFLYDPGDNAHYFFGTPEDRNLYAKEIIASYYDDKWDEDEVTEILAGEVTHITEKIMSVKRPPDEEINEDREDEDGNYWGDDFREICDYGLVPINDSL